MARFLNTDAITKGIEEIIENAEKELLIIVPYIRTWERLQKSLEKADKRRIEITIIYRENSLKAPERKKIEELNNLNLLNHPTVHSKSYMNENELILCSMNMYDHSAANNREMGVLFDMDDKGESSNDLELIQDAIEEMKAIVHASQVEKHSQKTKQEGLVIDLLMSEDDRIQAKAEFLNKTFINKRFEVANFDGFLSCSCLNYFENIDIHFAYRVTMCLNFPQDRLNQVFEHHKEDYEEFRIGGFKYYWNYPNQHVFLYRNTKHKMWKEASKREHFEHWKKGIDGLINHLRKSLDKHQ